MTKDTTQSNVKCQQVKLSPGNWIGIIATAAMIVVPTIAGYLDLREQVASLEATQRVMLRSMGLGIDQAKGEGQR